MKFKIGSSYHGNPRPILLLYTLQSYDFRVSFTDDGSSISRLFSNTELFYSFIVHCHLFLIFRLPLFSVLNNWQMLNSHYKFRILPLEKYSHPFAFVTLCFVNLVFPLNGIAPLRRDFKGYESVVCCSWQRCQGERGFGYFKVLLLSKFNLINLCFSFYTFLVTKKINILALQDTGVQDYRCSFLICPRSYITVWRGPGW